MSYRVTYFVEGEIIIPTEVISRLKPTYEEIQKTKDKKAGVESDSAQSSTGHKYTKVGNYNVRFKVIDSYSNETESAPLLVKVVGEQDKPKLSIISPNGGEILKVDEVFTFLWSKDAINTSKVRINIFDSKDIGLAKNIFGGELDNDGSEDWVVTELKNTFYDYQNEKYVEGSGYYMASIGCTGGSPCEGDVSDAPFTIIGHEEIELTKTLPQENTDIKDVEEEKAYTQTEKDTVVKERGGNLGEIQDNGVLESMQDTEAEFEELAVINDEPVGVFRKIINWLFSLFR